MEATSVPYHNQIEIEVCNNPSQGIYQLSESSSHLNHLRSIDASAVFTLAEVSSNVFLTQNLENLDQDEYIFNLRSADIKFRSASNGRIYSIGKHSEREWKRFQRALIKNGRALIKFPIHIMNESGKCIAVAQFEWFVFRKPQRQGTS